MWAEDNEDGGVWEGGGGRKEEMTEESGAQGTEEALQQFNECNQNSWQDVLFVYCKNRSACFMLQVQTQTVSGEINLGIEGNSIQMKSVDDMSV